jgi:hypothetical protein
MKPYHLNQASPRVIHVQKQEQIALARWASLESEKHPELSLLVHIVNDNYHEDISLQHFGFPDIFLPIPRFPFHGLFLTFSTKVSQPQAVWIANLCAQDYKAVAVGDFEKAKNEIEEYLCLK